MSKPSTADTMPVQERHRFDAARLEAWLAPRIEGFQGPLSVEQFKGGQSNPTFLLSAGARRFVLRRKPPGKLLPSAHAVDREYRVITALGQSDVPVAKTYCLCEDDSVIGTAFYVMDYVEGRIFWDPGLPEVSPSQRAAIYDEMNRVMAALHAVDYPALGLADYGKPGNYFLRQIERWTKQYRASETGRADDFERLIAWLPQNIPAGDDTAIVHGDFRLDNMIFHPSEPRVLAVLDWELSTLGHPLADFSFNCLPWHVPQNLMNGLAGRAAKPEGVPDERDYVEHYCRRTGRAPIPQADWDFYIAYNLFRLGAIAQGIMRRVIDGTAASVQAETLGRRAPELAALGWTQVEKILARRA
jgi:aminoglycoside phosphotransferase (APT) family kinase protein